MAVGYVIGAVTGVVLGLLFGRIKLLGDIFNPYITLFNGIPKVALAPVFVIWFGIGLMSKIAIILTMVFFVVFINTFAGLRSVNEEYVSIVRIMGASSLQVIREVFLPATVPYILVGLRAAFLLLSSAPSSASSLRQPKDWVTSSTIIRELLTPLASSSV